ncbi:penicillin acylase family protein [uncultured Shewanella sp.]|uniref:penicillin acylase family protein n=1 Tax=uncultured Shewanella sp. TaxID=173975 RepID=UPI00260DD0D7|nr:penicillin acylase family protein [uncultured Shewanella sp.]
MKKVVLVSLVFVLLYSAFILFNLIYSKPDLKGQLQFDSLNDQVSIEIDQFGVPLITYNPDDDLFFSIGFLHAQERFFQMDLLRRNAAGESSELFSFLSIEQDKSVKKFGLKERALEAFNSLPESQKQLLVSYSKGVNDGLNSLGAWPFEYALLLTKPEAWEPQDSILVAYSLSLELQDENAEQDYAMDVLSKYYSDDTVNFFAPKRTEWDAPVIEDLAPYQPEVLPAFIQAADFVEEFDISERTASGSNGWGLGGQYTASGAGLLANDIHLPLSAPSTWYQVSYQQFKQETLVSGITLPGLPFIISGSNGDVAWGVTNSLGKWSQQITLPYDQTNHCIITGKLCEVVTEKTLSIDARFLADEEFVVRRIKHALVLDIEGDKARVLQWMPLLPESFNLALHRIKDSKTVPQAIAVIQQSRGVQLDTIVTDKAGNVGWTVLGSMPVRGYPSDYWQQLLQPSEYPQLINPNEGRIWLANQRVASGDMLTLLGHGRYVSGARAKQIKQGLYALQSDVIEADMAQIQLDERALFLQRWHQKMLNVLQLPSLVDDINQADVTALVSILQQWSGKAEIDSVAHRMVRKFRYVVASRLLQQRFTVLEQKYPGFEFLDATDNWESPVWQLITKQPQDQVPQGFSSWNAFLFDSALNGVSRYYQAKYGDLERLTQGELNRTEINHPLSMVFPFLDPLINMPHVPIGGDMYMPKVQTRSFGSSVRLIVSPGHEDSALISFPGGQSGHPLSQNYKDGFKRWSEGEYRPLLPQKTVNSLILKPTN